MRTLIPLLVLLGACQDLGLGAEYELDRTRLLAARATPAEPAPGDLVGFEALGFSPSSELGYAWYLCWDLALFTDQCEIDRGLLDELRLLDWQTLQGPERDARTREAYEAGIFGIEPGFPPLLPVPQELLFALEIPELSEGLSVAVHVEAWRLDDAGTEAEDLEHAVKYVPVSLAETPNHNPDLLGLEVEGELLGPDEPLVVEAGGEVELLAVPAEGAIETYSFTTDDDVVEEREESLSHRWYAQAGPIRVKPLEGVTLDPPTDEANWTAPDEPGQGVIIVVVLDRRGGMGWFEQPYVVE